MQNDQPGDKDRHEIRMLGLLSCVVIDEISRALSEGVKVNGQLERMVDETFQNVKNEGVFWAEYLQDREKVCRASWAWIDDQVEALLGAERVSRDIINLSLVKRG